MLRISTPLKVATTVTVCGVGAMLSATVLGINQALQPSISQALALTLVSGIIVGAAFGSLGACAMCFYAAQLKREAPELSYSQMSSTDSELSV